MNDKNKPEFEKFWKENFDVDFNFTVTSSLPRHIEHVAAKELAYAVYSLQQTKIDKKQKRIDDLTVDLEGVTELAKEWRSYAQDTSNPKRGKCGHLINKGWVCFVCGDDPYGDQDEKE
jgi:hypothetical protein